MNNNINNNINNDLNNNQVNMSVNNNNNINNNFNNEALSINSIKSEEVDKKHNRNLTKMYFLGAIIITVSIIVIAMSGSYAYFVNEVAKENTDAAKVTITSGKLKMQMVFDEGSKNISWSNAKLIDVVDDTQDNGETSSINIDENKLPKDTANDYTSFTVSFASGNEVAKAKYELYLTDVSATANFFNKYVKWVLFEVNDGSNKQVAYGDFSKVTKSSAAASNGKDTVTVNNISLLSEVKISSNESKKYKLYFWLEDDKNQNQANDCSSGYDNCIDLREGKLSAKVAFRAVSVAGTE